MPGPAAGRLQRLLRSQQGSRGRKIRPAAWGGPAGECTAKCADELAAPPCSPAHTLCPLLALQG